MKNVYVVLAVLMLIVGCDKFKSAKTPGDEAQTKAADGVDAGAVASPKCSNGSEAKALKGECSGAWTFIQDGSKKSCHFTWGPTVECEKGQTTVSDIKAACYGVTVKDLTSSDKVSSNDDCSSKFGNPPQKISYELYCCK